MKNQLAKTRFSAALGIACHLFGRAASLGAIILICHSATAQDLYVSARDDTGGKVLRFSWDGLQSTFALGLSDPQGLAMDSAGNLFVADVVGDDPVISLIYKFRPDGMRSTFATLAGLPAELVFDATGNLFVSDYGRGSIYEYKPDGSRTTFASGLNRPQGLAFDRAGNLFVGETTYNGHIYKYKPNGTRATFASGFSGQMHLACDNAGNLFVSGFFGDIISGTVYKITPNGVRTTFTSGMYAPASLAFDYQGNLFVVDLGILPEVPSVIYEFTPAAKRSIFARAAGSRQPGLEFNYLAFQPLQPIPPPPPTPEN
jgi:DNA-binding beta-propeller fold protein YncE